MRIFVCTMSGRRIEIDPEPSDTLESVKGMLKGKIAGLDYKGFVHSQKGRMDPKARLCDYNVARHNTLYLCYAFKP